MCEQKCINGFGLHGEHQANDFPVPDLTADRMTDPQMDSCSGCKAGMPIEDGIHINRYGMPQMVCED